jgi:acetyl-CoA carboxylase biotin carboxyl carrier protein
LFGYTRIGGLIVDEKTILTIIDKFNTSSIAELELSEDNARLLLRKSCTGVWEAEEPPSGTDAGVRLGLPVSAAEEGELIASPIVATFYASSSPDQKPFAAPGVTVRAGETLCILEAMKMMNHLEAEFDCLILEVKAKSGDLVEYGQGLFRVQRA